VVGKLVHALALETVGGVVGSNLIDVSEVQLANALAAILATFAGITIDVSEVQLLNALIPIEVTPEGIVILVNTPQLSNELRPIEVIFGGSLTVSSAESPLARYSPIDEILVNDKSRYVRRLHRSNTRLPIVVTELGKVTDVSLLERYGPLEKAEFPMESKDDVGKITSASSAH
jgi:hypothetical protein